MNVYLPRSFKASFFLCGAIITAILLYSLFYPLHTSAGQVTLEWDFNSEHYVAGYVIHWGTDSHTYPDSADVGNYNTCTISGLNDGQIYYFSVTAYDELGNESPYSDEVYTDVNATDTDKDGLPDSDEIDIYTTDPLNADTDSDGAADGLEIMHGSNPIDPYSIPYCAADIDQNGDVGTTDLIRFMADYGLASILGEDPLGDFDEDGDVDGKDMNLFMASYGRSGCL
jgi:hypothetical protein